MDEVIQNMKILWVTERMYQKLIQINKKVSNLSPSIWDFLPKGGLKYQLHG
jgi:hypothetical protein